MVISESRQYQLLLISLGSVIFNEENTFSNVCDDIWHFDTEFINDNGDYVNLVH
jgi:hypothetical protein